MKSTLGKEDRMVQYLDFDLEILEKGKGYEAHVLYSPAGEARATFTPPFDRKDLDLLRASVEKAVLRRIAAKAARRLPTPEVAQLREFGEKLFASLVVNGVRDCYSRSCHEAQKESCGLRLKLRLPAALGQVPWEFLYSRSEGDFLGLSIYRSIVRYLELPHMPVQSLCVPAPLRILAVIANPKSQRLDPLDVAREKRVLQEALAALVQRGLVALDFLEGPATFRQLTRRLRKENYHVLHFMGHGGYDEETQEGVLVMENEQGGEAWAGSENLSRLLRDVPCTRLVFLNACQGAVTSEADPFSSVAGALVRAGVPAVVAMQFEITDAAAIILAQEFYESLADNLPVDAALAWARAQIVFEDPDSLEWATPVLFMRVADGRLFDVAAAAATTKQAETAGPARPGMPPVTPVPSAPRPDLDKLYTDALIAYHQGRWTAAAAGFQAVVEAQPDYEDAADRLQEIRRQEEQAAQKLAALYRQGLKAMDGRQWAEAVTCFQQVQAIDPGYRQVAQLLALAQGEVAIADYEHDIKRNPKDAAPHNNLGTVYYQLGRYDEAIAAYQRAIELDPKLAQPHHGLGIVYGDLGRYDEAIAAYQRAIELDPNFAAPHNNLGNVYYQLGRYDEAIAAYQRAIELDPKLAQPHHGLGNVYYQLGRYDEAIAEYQRASELDPKIATVHSSLAACYRKLGNQAKYAEQIKIARDVMATENEYNRACLEAICGNVDEALALLKVALEKKPSRLELARRDPDFEFIRDDPRFKALVGE